MSSLETTNHVLWPYRNEPKPIFCSQCGEEICNCDWEIVHGEYTCFDCIEYLNQFEE